MRLSEGHHRFPCPLWGALADTALTRKILLRNKPQGFHAGLPNTNATDVLWQQDPRHKCHRCPLTASCCWIGWAHFSQVLPSCLCIGIYYVVMAQGIAIHLLLILSKERAGRSQGCCFQWELIALTSSFETPTLLSQATSFSHIRDQKPQETQKHKQQRSTTKPSPTSSDHQEAEQSKH